MSAFQARYDGTCAAHCDYRVHPGDWIVKNDEGIFHVECVPTPSRYDIQPHEIVCSACFLVKPCRCDA